MLHKKINKSDIVNYETRIHTDVSLTSESLDSVQFISQSTNDNYWRFFKHNYYDNSGSYPYIKSDVRHFSGYGHKGIGQYLDKYNISSSYVGVSQKHFGDSILPTSFKLTDTSISSTTGTIVNPILLDDGKGNIYASNAYNSQSNNHLSSSENHVGNIFYDLGIVVLKETGSWSGSVSYLDLAKSDYSVDFKSDTSLYTTEYTLRIEPDEFLHTQNPTSRAYVSGSSSSGSLGLTMSPFYKSDVSGSVKDGFTFITTIGLYDLEYSSEPLIIARLPKPIRRTTKVPITFKLKVDNIF